MKKRYIILISILLLAVAGYFYVMQDFKQENSLLIHNGTILTLEDDLPSVEAIYVKDGIIQEMGTYVDLKKYKNQVDKVIDLKGKTLLPGFVDPHTHTVLSSFLAPMEDLSGFKHSSEVEVWEHLAEQSKNYKTGEWIVAKGIDPILVKDLKSPHISFLDSLIPNNPLLMLSQSLHTYWANSESFALMNIDKNTKDPTEHSYYEKDSAGELTGQMMEQEAFKPFQEVILKAFGKEKLLQSSIDALYDYPKNGNTTVTTMGMTTDNPQVLRLYQHLSGKATFTNQLFSKLGFLPERQPAVRHFVFIRQDMDVILPNSVENGDDFFKVVGVKLWYDGSPYTGSMYLKEPYLHSDLTEHGFHIPKGHKGEALIELDELTELVKKYQSKGWQIAVHTQGDLAIKETLKAFEANKDGENHRHRLEHCLLLGETEMDKMTELGVYPSIHINHLWYYGDALRDEIIGAERAEKILPVQQTIDRSLKPTLHADQPMFESDPLSLIHTAVNRKTRAGNLLGEANQITVLNALKAMTINGAFQIKMENKIGSLKVGKYADFVILDKNPLTVPAESIKDIQVLQTIINGNTIFVINE